jgi:hypothetical protein
MTRKKKIDLRCGRCRFWEIDRVKDYQDDDQEGGCHRYAPHMVSHQIADTLGMIAWAVEETAGIKHDKEFDYRDESVSPPWLNWPRTRIDDWCGEFQERL